jgi:hypothetical protein
VSAPSLNVLAPSAVALPSCRAVRSTLATESRALSAPRFARSVSDEASTSFERVSRMSKMRSADANALWRML